jgi:hypothetical protein
MTNLGAVNGRAAFAGVALLVGIGLTFIAERVGAPEGLVRALGPIFALPGVALIGLLSRSSRVASFFAADRAAPAAYAGLAFAGIAAGLVLCLSGKFGAPSQLPSVGVALGLCLGALVFGPAVRRANASDPADLFARRFGGWLLRWLLAPVFFVVGALLTAASFEVALEAIAAEQIVSRATAIVAVGVTLALVVAPGGLTGLLWAAAACGGALLLTLGLPIAARLLAASGDTLAWAGTGLGGADALDHIVSAAPPVLILASAIGVAAMAPLAGFGAAVQNQNQSLRAGASGFFFLALMAAGTLIDADLVSGGLGPAASAIRTGVSALAAIALAGAGALSASRSLAANSARRIDTRRAPASQRLAGSRGTALILIGVCGSVLHSRAIDPSAAILWAVVLSLALVAPILALNFSPRATAIHALASLFVSLGVLIALALPDPLALSPTVWLFNALVAAMAGIAVGWGTSLLSRSRPAHPPNVSRDPYFEPSSGQLP